MRPQPPIARAANEGRAAKVLMIGVDHRCAPLDLRERLAYESADAEATLGALTVTDAVAEACLLSTCNRTELYLCTQDEATAYRAALERVFLSRAPEIEREGRFYVKRDHEAARHLLEVASGLQSMVLGEPEILGQVKQAGMRAQTVGSTGPILHQMLKQATTAGKRAHRETAISNGAVSFGYAVVDLGRTIFHRLADCSVLMIGAGETARLVARNLLERGVGSLTVANRSTEGAEAFVHQFDDARSVPFAQRVEALRGTDIAVTTTAASEPVLDRAQLETVMHGRRRPLLLVDLGVPRNVEPAAKGLENLFLQDLDALQHLIERNLKRRREEIPKVHDILDTELDRFAGWLHGQRAEPLLAQLHGRAETLRRQEVEAAHAHFPPELHDHLDTLSKALVRKLLHHPSRHLRTLDRSSGDLASAKRLFRLDDDP